MVFAASCREPESVPNVPRDFAGEQARFDAERRPDKIIAALDIGPGSKVADIGAGDGKLTVHLAAAVRPDGLVIATDINKSVLDFLQLRLEAAGLEGLVEQRVVNPDIPGLETGSYNPIIDEEGLDDDPVTEAGTYDAIVLSEVDHLFANPVAWLSQAARSLAPGGRLAITNRLHHRQGAMAAARRANLILVSESAPTPTHFLAVFTKR